MSSVKKKKMMRIGFLTADEKTLNAITSINF